MIYMYCVFLGFRAKGGKQNANSTLLMFWK